MKNGWRMMEIDETDMFGFRISGFVFRFLASRLDSFSKKVILHG